MGYVAADDSGFAGIFTIDQVVHPVVNFTNDRPALDDALKKVSMTAGDPLVLAPTVASAESSGPPPIEIPSFSREPGGLRIRMLQTLDALAAIVAAMEHLPGRKSVILFSEGLATGGWLDDDRHDRLLRVMALANRSHVAFYTFDAAGLRIGSTVEYAEAAPYVALQTMADETGGAFVDSTNDLTDGIDRVTADLRQYYLLGYSSSKPPDDKYRTIDVKVKGKDITVLARKGYRASRGPDLAVVKPPEVAPLLLLDRSEEPADIPLRAGTLRVATADAQDRTVLLARVPLNALTFDTGPTSSRPTARLTIVARVKDKKSEVVQYAAQTYDLTGQAGQTRAGAATSCSIATSRCRRVRCFWRSRPSTPTASTAAFSGCRWSSYQPSRRGFGPEGSSSLTGCSGAAHLAPRPSRACRRCSSATGCCCRISASRSCRRPISSSGSRRLPIRRGAQTEGTVAVVQDGQSAAVTPLQLSSRAETGRIAYVGHLPIGTLTPGSYSLVLTLRQGAATLTRTAPFTVARCQRPSRCHRRSATEPRPHMRPEHEHSDGDGAEGRDQHRACSDILGPPGNHVVSPVKRGPRASSIAVFSGLGCEDDRNREHDGAPFGGREPQREPEQDDGDRREQLNARAVLRAKHKAQAAERASDAPGPARDDG